MRALVTGATGFVGRRLLSHLKRPVILSRPGSKQRASVTAAHDVTTYDWQPLSDLPPTQAFDNVDVVIHLAGESIASGRWTQAKKERIYSSRVTGTSHLVTAMASLPRPPQLLISASAIGYYGSRGDELLRETSSPGDDFLAEVCVAWERAAQTAQEAGIRVVLPRIGLVVGAGGGPLATLLTPFRWGLGGKISQGGQWMSWIHLDDLAQLFLFLIEHETIHGPVNATAPHPVTNAEFTRTLGQALHRPTWLTIPKPALQLALGQFSEVLLASQRVIPEVASRAGFQFQYPALPAAMRQVVAG